MATATTASTATTKPATKKVAKGTKKASPSKASHPTYFQMIKDAIVALREKGGSSPYAIAKYMEEHHKADLPGNFKKILGHQLKNSVAKGKLLKVKASFKLSDAAKKEKAPKPKAAEKKPKVPKVAEKKPKAAEKKPKADPAKKQKATTAKPAKKGPAKKAPVKKAGKSTPMKRKAPKSIKSSAAKKAKKA